MSQKKSWIALISRINRYHKNLWLKSTNTFEDSQTNQQKNSTSSKEERLCATHANFSRCRYQGNRKSHNPSKNSKIQSISCQIRFRFQLQTFPQKCNKREIQSKTLNTDKKLILIIEPTITVNRKKSKRICSQFVSFMFKQYLSTRSKPNMHLKKFNLFHVFAGHKLLNSLQERAGPSTNRCFSSLH